MERKVFVYRNLHLDCWSVKDVKSGLVILRCESVRLYKVRFKVSEAGRQRVLRDKRKNVHAGVEGYLEKAEHLCPSNVKYNPYKYGYFYLPYRDDMAVYTAEHVELDSKGKVYAKL